MGKSKDKKNVDSDGKKDDAIPVASVRSPIGKSKDKKIVESAGKQKDDTIPNATGKSKEKKDAPIPETVDSDDSDDDESAIASVPTPVPLKSPPRKSIKLSNLTTTAAKGSSAAKKTYVKVTATRVAGLEAYWVEEFQGQDGFNWNLCKEIAITKLNQAIIEQGFFIWGDRRKSKSEDVPLANKLASTNGVSYNRRLFFRCIPDVGTGSTKETRDEGLHVLQKYFMHKDNNLYQKEYAVNADSDLTPANPEKYPALDDLVVDSTIVRLLVQYAPENSFSTFAKEFPDYSKCFFSRDPTPPIAASWGY